MNLRKGRAALCLRVMDRRTVLRALATAPAAAACRSEAAPEPTSVPVPRKAELVLRTQPLGSPPWPTLDPFLFCVHHNDAYPLGNERLGPAAALTDRNLGSDFAGRDGWNMYHGEVVPGFPRHPHRGFETVTIVRRGLVDHSDSLGASARYGEGDVQWLTAGKGIVHSEMFPLLRRDAPNPMELFQIWLNLPSTHKFVDPHFSMFWSHTIPRREQPDERGKGVELTAIAGNIAGLTPPSPPPNSWASQPDSDLAIWTLKLAPGARFTLPSARAGTQRALYFFEGERLRVGSSNLTVRTLAELAPEFPALLENMGAAAEVLVLQGRPIGEPTAKQGPFVMNTPQELRQAYLDYRQTGFGGWPWQYDGPVHGTATERFARHADGRVERAG